MIHTILLGAALALGSNASFAKEGSTPLVSLSESLPPPRSSFMCVQLLTDSADAARATAEIKAVNKAAAKEKAAARKAAKAAALAQAIAAEEAARAAGQPVASSDVDLFHQRKVAVELDPSGRAMKKKYDVVKALSVPRAQLTRLAPLTADKMSTRLLNRFRGLINSNFLKAPGDSKLLIDDTNKKVESAAARLAIRRVGARLDELTADDGGEGKPYLMRRVLKGRRLIEARLAELAANARLLERTLQLGLMTGPDGKPVAPKPAPPVAPAPQPEYIHMPAIEIPGLTTREASQTWKALGWGTLAAAGFVTLFLPDPKITMPLFFATAGGLSFLSASVRSEVSGLIANVKTIFRERREAREAAAAATLMAQRHERNLIQIETLEEISQRLSGNGKEYGLAYYSFLSEASTAVVAGAALDVSDPFANPKLLRNEIIVFTDETSHYMATFVSDVTTGEVLMTNLSLEPGT